MKRGYLYAAAAGLFLAMTSPLWVLPATYILGLTVNPYTVAAAGIGGGSLAAYRHAEGTQSGD